MQGRKFRIDYIVRKATRDSKMMVSPIGWYDGELRLRTLPFSTGTCKYPYNSKVEKYFCPFKESTMSFTCGN